MEKFFKLKENNTNVKTEVIAGFTTFMAMAYIIVVNPGVLVGWENMGNPLFNSVLVATCISAAIGTLIMGLYAKLPFAQAPGMGLNAFFAITIMGIMGYTFNQGLAIVFISGCIFILLTLTGLREKIVDAIPANIKYAITAGIGLFIALIGLKNAGLLVISPTDGYFLCDFSKYSEVKPALVALIGLVIIAILMMYKVRGALLYGILIATLIGIPFGVTDINSLQGASWTPPSIEPTLFQLDFGGLFADKGALDAILALIMVVVAFTLVDMFDTIGTLVGTATRAGMVDKNGRVIRMNKALMADAVATTAGALLGTSTVTTYLESNTGISEGGRTGLTAVVVAILFVLALFLSPIALLIPGAATAPALIIVGVLMIGAVKNIDFDGIDNALPAFLTMVMMPFTQSIATGIAFGFISFSALKLFKGKGKEVHPIIYVLAILFIIRFIIMPG
ncbi:NCS2 family permease [Vallitalea pronyensis]|uniref:NCS2 family permease n=1 Tax=Vallitalea pronyensis TaxID=1348613 RepID=A0A8J8SGU9_9FIRM|nr:NCS2 family permease [Vallitalea pronyensis]QUI22769.1 NCS2 family permease [Vallitalea pronyensis]